MFTSPGPLPASFAAFTSRARWIAPASPAAPPPTNTTSISTFSSDGVSFRIRRSIGRRAW